LDPTYGGQLYCPSLIVALAFRPAFADLKVGATPKLGHYPVNAPIEFVPGLAYSSRAELYCLAALPGGPARQRWCGKGDQV